MQHPLNVLPVQGVRSGGALPLGICTHSSSMYVQKIDVSCIRNSESTSRSFLRTRVHRAAVIRRGPCFFIATIAAHTAASPQSPSIDGTGNLLTNNNLSTHGANPSIQPRPVGNQVENLTYRPDLIGTRSLPSSCPLTSFAGIFPGCRLCSSPRRRAETAVPTTPSSQADGRHRCLLTVRSSPPTI